MSSLVAFSEASKLYQQRKQQHAHERENDRSYDQQRGEFDVWWIVAEGVDDFDDGCPRIVLVVHDSDFLLFKFTFSEYAVPLARRNVSRKRFANSASAHTFIDGVAMGARYRSNRIAIANYRSRPGISSQ